MKWLYRIKCWWRGYHIGDASHVYKFRYDISGMCHDCGKVGSGEFYTDSKRCKHVWIEEGFRRHCDKCGNHQQLMDNRYPEVGEPKYEWH